MRGDDKVSENFNLLRMAINAINDQRTESNNLLLQECKACWRSNDHLPLELLRRLAWSGKGAQWLRDHHPFFPITEAIEQIETAFEMLVAARSSLIELYGHYHAAIIYDGFDSTKEVSLKTTHEVFKYVFAAAALVQAYRRFLSLDGSYKEGYDRVFKSSFNDIELMKFLQDLRNCYGHQTILRVAPVGTVYHDETKKTVSALTFDKEKLLKLKGTWSTEARQFLERADELNLLDTINQYHQMAKSLFHSYESATRVLHRPEYREISRCKLAIDLAPRIMWLGILLQQAKQRSIDPYAHLNDYFTMEELERINCFRTHTREQVDFMIAIRDPIGLCSDELRQGLYSVFGCE